MVNCTRINSAPSIFFWNITRRQAISPVAKFHHMLGCGFIIQRVILIFIKCLSANQNHYFTLKYNIYTYISIIRAIISIHVWLLVIKFLHEYPNFIPGVDIWVNNKACQVPEHDVHPWDEISLSHMDTHDSFYQSCTDVLQCRQKSWLYNSGKIANSLPWIFQATALLPTYRRVLGLSNIRGIKPLIQSQKHVTCR